jgi:uncharacterized protein YndB with AHSA1/START domain
MVSYGDWMEAVFKALADQTRRDLLDELFRLDGQTLTALAGRFAMTRVAVAKHLRLLEDAQLVITRRHGREKRHFLNAVPIRLIHDRWVTKYTQGWTEALADLKNDLEDTMEKVFEIYIRCSPERLWQTIIDPDARTRYQFGARVQSSWMADSTYQVVHPQAPRPLIEGENIEVDPPRRLVQSYRARWDDDVAAAGTSRVTWEIEPVGDSCRLCVIHDELPVDADPHLYGGWPMILSGLKTWIETGEQLTTPGSLAYGGAV